MQEIIQMQCNKSFTRISRNQLHAVREIMRMQCKKSFICNARNHSHARQEIIHMQCKKSFTYNARNHSHALQEIIHMQCKKSFICNARNQYDIMQGIIIRNYNISLHCIINYVMHCNKPLNSKAKNILPLHRYFLCILFSETIFLQSTNRDTS